MRGCYKGVATVATGGTPGRAWPATCDVPRGVELPRLGWIYTVSVNSDRPVVVWVPKPAIPPCSGVRRTLGV